MNLERRRKKKGVPFNYNCQFMVLFLVKCSQFSLSCLLSSSFNGMYRTWDMTRFQAFITLAFEQVLSIIREPLLMLLFNKSIIFSRICSWRLFKHILLLFSFFFFCLCFVNLCGNKASYLITSFRSHLFQKQIHSDVFGPK